MRAARGFTVGLPVLLAFSAATSIYATTTSSDGIPEVGIGSVHPICDPLSEECISSDEQVQDDILEGLEAEDKVTGTSCVAVCPLPWQNTARRVTHLFSLYVRSCSSRHFFLEFFRCCVTANIGPHRRRRASLVRHRRFELHYRAAAAPASVFATDTTTSRQDTRGVPELTTMGPPPASRDDAVP